MLPGRRHTLPLALYPFLLFFFGILHKLLLLSIFQVRSTPTFLVYTGLSQHSPQTATMRLLFHDCLPLPRLQRRQALCRQAFVITLLTQIDRVGLLIILDHYRSKLPESEGFITATVVTPKHRSSWNAVRAWHETFFLFFIPAQVQ